MGAPGNGRLAGAESRGGSSLPRNDVPYPELDTPAILVDLDRLQANIDAMAGMAAEAGIKLRPHTKVHKGTFISGLQLDAGAIGVSVSKLSEAAVYADAGQSDIMVVHPFYGHHKMRALQALHARADISCVVDSLEGASAIGEVGEASGRDVPVLLKINTSCNRFGVSPGDATLRVARDLDRVPGIELVGIITHESAMSLPSAQAVKEIARESASIMSESARTLREAGIGIEHVVAGSTPTSSALCEYASDFPEITEIHPGAYVFGDRGYVSAFGMREEACSATILVTVVSTPAADRACVDGGYKTFGADPMLFTAARVGGLGSWSPSYGSVVGRPDIGVGRLTEEIGILTLRDPDGSVSIGERLEILPNHVSLAVNLHDTIYGVRNGRVEREIPVVCRGMDY